MSERRYCEDCWAQLPGDTRQEDCRNCKERRLEAEVRSLRALLRECRQAFEMLHPEEPDVDCMCEAYCERVMSLLQRIAAALGEGEECGVAARRKGSSTI